MIHTDCAIARIRAYLTDYKIAKSRLAIMAGVPEGCTRNIESKDWNPTSDTLRKLEEAIPADYDLPTSGHKTNSKKVNPKTRSE